MNKKSLSYSALVPAFVALALLAGCGGGHSSNPSPTFLIGGTVSGLNGTVVLQNNTANDLTISSNGSFTFPTPIASGNAYTVIVKTQPSTPSQTCVVANGSGTVGGGNITNIAINCTTNTYTVGGTISGLNGTVVLQNNAANDLTINSNGSFTFTTPIASGSAYAVTVKTQPNSPKQSCSVISGSSNVGNSNINTVVVTCINVYSIGGTITGLNGTVTLQNNAASDWIVNANGSFTFATLVQAGGSYSVTVKTQPASPVQSCVVTNGTGTDVNANVTNITIACTTLLLVTSTSPTNNAINFARTGALTIQFSSPIDAATVTPANFTLTSSKGNPTLNLTASGGQVIATPVGSLAQMTDYTLQISAAVRGQAGEVAPSNVTVHFKTRDGAWGTPAVIEMNSTGDAARPQIAIDQNKNAFAVWYQYDGTRYNIWSNRYTFGVGWGTPVLLETDNTGDAFAARIAVGGGGNAFAIWQQSDGTRSNIWANRYTPGVGWGTAELIENDNTADAAHPQITVDSNGNAIAGWDQSDGSHSNVWANRYTAGVGWGTAIHIEGENLGGAIMSQIVNDATGNAYAIWNQFNGVRNNIWANRYVSGVGWGTATIISAGDAFGARIAVDGDGNAFTVWQQYLSSSYDIWSNRYVLGIGWRTPGIIENATGLANAPQVAVDANGNALAVWTQYDGARSNVWTNRYTASVGWGTPTMIYFGNSAYSQIAFDAYGNALAIWENYLGTPNSIWSSRYIAGTGWGTATLVETNDLGDAAEAQIAFDSEGNAIAVWEQFDNGYISIWSNRFQ